MSERVWVVERYYRNGVWERSQVPEVDSCSSNYYQAHKIKRAHQQHARKWSKWWTKGHFRVREYARLETMEAKAIAPNTGSPKLPLPVHWHLFASGLGITPKQGKDIYEWWERQLRAGAR